MQSILIGLQKIAMDLDCGFLICNRLGLQYLVCNRLGLQIFKYNRFGLQFVLCNRLQLQILLCNRLGLGLPILAIDQKSNCNKIAQIAIDLDCNLCNLCNLGLGYVRIKLV